jgi:small nuclear ribonucleoprotein (snRNP)-like protein
MDEDNDDYMNMVIADPVEKREKETYTQRRIRKQREVGGSLYISNLMFT